MAANAMAFWEDRKMFRWSTRRWLLAAAAAVPAAQSRAQDVWPSRPMRLLVPFAAGGGMDMVARLLAPLVTEALGRQVVVENRPGATGTITMAEVAHAPPDGYTMMITGTSYSIVSLLMPQLPFGMDDFAPLSRLTVGPNVLVVSRQLGIGTLAEFIAAARTHPGQWSYGTTGVGTSLHLATEMLKQRAGIDLVHVPYRGTAPAMADLLAGRLQTMFATVPDALQLIGTGQLRGLAICYGERVAALPEVPTFSELGYAEVRASSDFGLAIGARTPEAICRRLEAAFRTAVRRPEVRDRLAQVGMFVVGSSAVEFAQIVAEETTLYADVIRLAGVKLE